MYASLVLLSICASSLEAQAELGGCSVWQCIKTGYPTSPQYHGDPGMTLQLRSGLVNYVFDGQAAQHGVKRGWVVEKVNGNPYSPMGGNYLDATTGDKPYTLQFQFSQCPAGYRQVPGCPDCQPNIAPPSTKPTPAPPMPTGCTVAGPSYSINGTSKIVAEHKGVENAAACASQCQANGHCTAFHYYGLADFACGDCYLHSGGMITGPLGDGRDRYAGTCDTALVSAANSAIVLL